mmetsp:Transcript_45799/g.97706  ORF Transcript_45799/g.97706 Transcript_45799/m.97706 type:complete len:253 (-) Transcript_45799:961-1719(-)
MEEERGPSMAEEGTPRTRVSLVAGREALDEDANEHTAQGQHDARGSLGEGSLLEKSAHGSATQERSAGEVAVERRERDGDVQKRPAREVSLKVRVWSGAQQELHVQGTREGTGPLGHDSSRLRARVEHSDAMRRAVPRGSNAREGQLRVEKHEHRVVHTRGARAYLVEHPALGGLRGGEEVHREGHRLAVDVLDGRVDAVDTDEGDDRAEDLLLHERRVGARLDDHRRRHVLVGHVDPPAGHDSASMVDEQL